MAFNNTTEVDFEGLFNAFREHQLPYYPDIGVFSFRDPRVHAHPISEGLHLIESTKRVILKNHPSLYYYHFNRNINLQYFNQLSDRICLTTSTPIQIDGAASENFSEFITSTEDVKLFFFCDGFCCDQVCCSMNPVILTLLFTFIAILILIVLTLFVVWRHNILQKQFAYKKAQRFEMNDDVFDSTNKTYHNLSGHKAKITSLNNITPKTAVACKTDSVFSKVCRIKTLLFDGRNIGNQINNYENDLLCDDELKDDLLELESDTLIAEGVFV
uniref:CX domain-containing protein n=1 Tax=Strongyloides stercoralis TaxID=6248 RepID=A0A0K0ERF8_STRER